MIVSSQQLISVAAGLILPFVFAGFVFFSRTRSYPTWARYTSIAACVTALVWATLVWIVWHWHGLHLGNITYYQVVAIKDFLAGFCFGLVLSITIASPRRAKKSAVTSAKNEEN